MTYIRTDHRGTEAQRDTEPKENGLAGFELSKVVIACAIEVHRELGPGLLESAYEEALCYELTLRDITFERQLELPVQYKGRLLPHRYRMDVLVDKQLLIELKAVDQLLPLHRAQTLTYLRMSGIKTALLINFNVEALKQGIKRVSL
jgi:GxxExxY protein